MGKIIEVDEDQLLADRKLRSVVQNIMANPKAKLLVQQAHKMVDATALTPELDTQATIAAPISELEKKVDAFISESAKEKSDREKNDRLNAINTSIDTGLSRLRADGWTDEGVKGVRAIMEEKGILDVEVAAAYFEKQHPPQSPVTPGGQGSWNFLDMPTEGGDDDLKKLIETKGENNALLDKMARDALTDVRGQTRRS